MKKNLQNTFKTKMEKLDILRFAQLGVERNELTYSERFQNEILKSGYEILCFDTSQTGYQQVWLRKKSDNSFIVKKINDETFFTVKQLYLMRLFLNDALNFSFNKKIGK